MKEVYLKISTAADLAERELIEIVKFKLFFRIKSIESKTTYIDHFVYLVTGEFELSIPCEP